MSDQFTRREVNRALLVGAVALVASPIPLRTAHPTTPLFDFAIAGGWYHGLKDVCDKLSIGERLTLKHEPDNPYDCNAVAVCRTDGLMLGYVPRAANEPIARLLQQAAQIDAVVVERLNFNRAADIPDDFVFTGLSNGDPRIRLTLVAANMR